MVPERGTEIWPALIELVFAAELVFPEDINSDFVARLKRCGCSRGRGQRLLLGLTDRAGTAARNQKGHSEQSATDQDPPVTLRLSSLSAQR